MLIKNTISERLFALAQMLRFDNIKTEFVKTNVGGT